MVLWFKNNSAWSLISAIMAFFFISCAGEQETAFVDFSDRIIVERPGDGDREDTHFKVAVGSIISARETVVFYHELLKYIAEKLGRDIQLVQRKTCQRTARLDARSSDCTICR